MNYRTLGNTGLSVSAIGLGCENLDFRPYEEVSATISAALESGINIFDVFMPGTEIRDNIAKALGIARKDVVVQGHIGSTDVRQKYDISRDMPTVKKYFEEMLRLFGYIDIGMLFFIDSEQDYRDIFETAFIAYAQHLKAQGDIRHIGFSSHNPKTAIQVINTGVPEMMMFSINPAFDLLPSDEYVLPMMENGFGSDMFSGLDPVRAELYKLCSSKNIGITVMKSMGGGRLVSPEHTPFTRPLTAPQCVHYALSRPAVSSVLAGCRTPEEIADTMRYFTQSGSALDFSDILRTPRNDFIGNCVYCGHCQPCPAEIDISAVNKYLDIARLDMQNVSPSIRTHYGSLPHGGGECLRCGSCESRCPFDVPIIANMAEAETLLGK